MIIRRPLAVLFLAYMLGIGANYIFSPEKYIFAAGVFLSSIAALVSLIMISERSITLLLTALIVFSVGGLACEKQMTKSDPMDSYEGQKASFSGTCLKYQKKDEDFVKLTVKNGSNSYLVHIYGGEAGDMDPEDLIGSRLIFTGEVQKPSPARNPGGFDYSLYLRSVGVRWIISCERKDISVTKPVFKDEPVNWFYSGLASVKYGFLEAIRPYMSSESHGLLSGMLFGSKDGLDEDTYEDFQKNGIAHILSVSGIHVGIVYSFLFVLLGKRTNTATTIAIFIFLFIYTFLSEFSPSVIRAALMIGIHILTKLLKYPYDLLSGTALAAFIMLVLNPLALFNVGFQLSFMAVFLLAFFIPLMKRYVGRKRLVGVYKERFRDTGERSLIPGSHDTKKKIVDSLMPLLVIQLGMAPFSVFVFNYFSVAGLFMNIPVIAISAVIIPAGVCLIPFSMFGSGFLYEFVLTAGGGFLDLILTVMMRINDLVSSMDFSSLTLVSPPPWVLLLFYGLLFFFSSETFRIIWTRKMRMPPIITVSLIIVVALTCSHMQILQRDDSDMVFVDVGQGDCIHVRTPSGKNILVDGGGSADYDVGKKTLLPYLLKNGVKKLDHVFVTHLHTDHFQGIRELSNHMDIGSLITYDGNKVRQDELISGSGIRTDSLVYAARGDRFVIDDGIYIDILYPEKRDAYTDSPDDEEDENKNTLFMKLHYKNVSVLITGDLDENGEQQIMREYADPNGELGSTILKVGHHGSKYSTSDEFLEAVSPKAAVIQVGKNNYGHPTPEVIEKMENKDIILYRNDADGAVMLDLESGSIKFRTMIDKEKNGL